MVAQSWSVCKIIYKLINNHINSLKNMKALTFEVRRKAANKLFSVIQEFKSFKTKD